MNLLGFLKKKTIPQGNEYARSKKDFGWYWRKLTFSMKTRMGLYERIGAYVENGVDIVTTMKTIKRRYDMKRSTKNKGLILKEWIEVMEYGGEFHDAIQDWVPSSEHMLIAASHGSNGGLVEGLKEARVLAGASAKAKGAIMGGTIFPLVLFSMIIFMLIMFQVQMVPIFKTLLPIPKWPDSAQTLNSISSFLKNNIFIVLGVAVVTAIIVSWTMPRWKGPIRVKYVDKLPPWSIYRTYQASSFLISLASMMKGGTSTYDALRSMHKTASPWMQSHLDKMMFLTRQGLENPGDALDTGLLHDDDAGDIKDYSSLNNFPDAVYIIGQRALEEGVKGIQVKMDVIKNLLLFAVAASIAWIYLTTYGLQNVIASNANSFKN